MFGIDDIIGAGLKILDKVIPDPKAKAEAQLKLLELHQAGEFKQLDADLQMAQGQIDTNKIEAADSGIFKSGWRPSVGWTCSAAFAMNFVIGPLLEWGSTLYGKPVKFPVIDMTTMLPVLLGMLGLGYYRTKEKLEGKA